MNTSNGGTRVYIIFFEKQILKDDCFDSFPTRIEKHEPFLIISLFFRFLQYVLPKT